KTQHEKTKVTSTKKPIHRKAVFVRLGFIVILKASASSRSRPSIVTVTRLAALAGGDETGGMKSPPDPNYRHRFPAEIISHAVWLYHVFGLSLRDVELLLAKRGIAVSYETVRRWCKKF